MYLNCKELEKINELNDSGKEQLLGLLKEKGINITKDELDEKLNKLNDADLEKISGGGNQNLDVYERLKKQVSGPKINIANCPYCNMPVPAGLLDDHIKNAHIDPLAELIKKSEIF